MVEQRWWREVDRKLVKIQQGIDNMSMVEEEMETETETERKKKKKDASDKGKEREKPEDAEDADAEGSTLVDRDVDMGN